MTTNLKLTYSCYVISEEYLVLIRPDVCAEILQELTSKERQYHGYVLLDNGVVFYWQLQDAKICSFKLCQGRTSWGSKRMGDIELLCFGRILMNLRMMMRTRVKR